MRVFPYFDTRFQSTLPVGGATLPYLLKLLGIDISIHAPRGGSDQEWESSYSQGTYFNPRSPWGERLTRQLVSFGKSRFQSTLPVGGATNPGAHGLFITFISIHAPRGGSDRQFHSPHR